MAKAVNYSRTMFEPEHELFRESYRAFLDKHVAPYHAQWEKDKIVDRGVWLEAGKQGYLSMAVPEEYGGGGNPDFRYNTIVCEETVAGGYSGLGFALHNDVIAPYLLNLTTREQKERWLPQFATGEMITAIAMTEPGTGSDLQGIKTRAVKEGDHYILNGSKTFITNGINADLVLLACKTDPSQKHKGMSIVVVERGTEGFERGRNLDKVGLHAQDTAELFFTDARVPVANRIGEEGDGFLLLVKNLPQERLSIAMSAVAHARTMLEWTKEYCNERTAFGQKIGSFQNSRFKLAEMETEVSIAEVFVDEGIKRLNEGTLTAEDASMAKWWVTELQKRVADICVQLHGGYGYMNEYPIARAYKDARITSIYGGTTEIMKEIIGRSLGF